MKYAHLADLHLGSWRDEKMRNLSERAFLTAIDNCIQENVDFILFAGDLFNTALPSVNTLKLVTKKLRELHDKNIPLYVIAGSHDFSPSGKTVLDVLENAGLLVNVCKGSINQETKQLHLQFTVDPKTQAKITGILGRKGLLDRSYYENLHLPSLEQESGYKIFMFHTTLSELKPQHLQDMESQPASFLPKNFNYYAGGHVHHPTIKEIPEYGTLTYTGALFPNSFAEVEKYQKGGYYIVSVNQIQEVTWIPLEVIPCYSFRFDCSHKTPEQSFMEISNHFENIDINNKLITLRIHGELASGKVSDIRFKELYDKLYERGAYFVMKNTAKLHSKEFEEIKISAHQAENIEENIIKEHLQQSTLFDKDTEHHLITSLLSSLNTSKKEGETINDFQERVNQDVKNLLNLDQ